jgi:hypothetical protein
MDKGISGEHYLLHSFIGAYPQTMIDLMRRNNRTIDHEKFISFYAGGNTVEELEKNLGLDIREIMCCASKKDPAATYHRPYGLILSGTIRTVFDNDSGTIIMPDGTYNIDHHYKFAHETNINNILNDWYNKFSNPETKHFYWNEVILNKGSKIVGAFHDKSFDPTQMKNAYQCTFKEKEYEKFLEKTSKLQLKLIEINAKYK